MFFTAIAVIMLLIPTGQNQNYSLLRLDGSFIEAKIIDTPNTKTIEELSQFLNIPSSTICKTLVYIVDNRPILALIRGDLTVEEIKLKNAVGANDIRIATGEEIKELMNKNGLDAETGFIGPNGINIQIIGDNSIIDLKNFVIGINQTDKHLVALTGIKM